MKKKLCSKCKIQKWEDEFWKDKVAKSGLKSSCKKCTIPINKNYRSENRKKVKEIERKSSNKYYHKNKNIINEKRRKNYKLLFIWNK